MNFDSDRYWREFATIDRSRNLALVCMYLSQTRPLVCRSLALTSLGEFFAYIELECRRRNLNTTLISAPLDWDHPSRYRDYDNTDLNGRTMPRTLFITLEGANKAQEYVAKYAGSADENIRLLRNETGFRVQR